MNELINVTLNENHEPVTTINTFEQLYLYVSKTKVQADISELKKLKEFVRGFYFSDWSEAAVYLNDEIDLEITYRRQTKLNDGNNEAKMQREIYESFGQLFPDYEKPQTEFSISTGRVDIFAIEKLTGRPVVIELKIGAKNPTNQLLAYAHNFHDPILIGITNEEIDTSRMHSGIIYYTYSKGELRSYE